MKNILHLSLKRVTKLASCPCCVHPSHQPHNSYTRIIHDLPICDKEVILIIQLHKWFCNQTNCSTKIFTERLPWLDPYRKKPNIGRNLKYACIFNELSTSWKSLRTPFYKEKDSIESLEIYTMRGIRLPLKWLTSPMEVTSGMVQELDPCLQTHIILAIWYRAGKQLEV